MSFSSHNDLLAEITAGKFLRLPFYRVVNTGATTAAGRWHECFAGNGTGGIGVLTGTAGAAQAYSAASPGALPIGAAVTPDTRHLLGMSAVAATSLLPPSMLLLVDLLLAYPSLSVSSPTALSNGVSLPRYATGDGVQAAAVVTSALGAASPTFTLTYTDSDGNTGNTGTLASPVNSAPIGCMLGGGTAASAIAPMMPLAAGDRGVRSVQSYSIASGTTGAAAIILYKPLATLPLAAANLASERDFLFALPSLPQIEDGACLALFALVGGALTTNQVVTGHLDLAWG